MTDGPNNIFLIIVDCLREDYGDILWNSLKQLGFIRVDNTISPSNWTTPSHASILTGLYPLMHGAHETNDKIGFQVRLRKPEILLSRFLENMGYTNYLISANPYIRPEFGFVGFKFFYDILYNPSFPLLSPNDRVKLRQVLELPENKTRLDSVKYLLKKGEVILLSKSVLSYLLKDVYIYLSSYYRNWPLDKSANNFINLLKIILRKIDNSKSQNFFLVNLLDVHEPYSIYDRRNWKFRYNFRNYKNKAQIMKIWQKRYPLHVEYVSQKILEFIKLLKVRGIYDNSLIIITSDHGQLLGEYDILGHGAFLYDELLKVPLFVKPHSGIEITNDSEKISHSFVSLTKVKDLILECIYGSSQIKIEEVLCSEAVFAETYGGNVTKTELGRDIVENMSKYRIAIYYKNFKGIFNVTDWKFEEIISYNPDIEVTDDAVKHLKKEILKFLKTGTSVKVPKIRV